MKQFRCTFSEGSYKVGQILSEFQFNNLPSSLKGNFKPL